MDGCRRLLNHVLSSALLYDDNAQCGLLTLLSKDAAVGGSFMLTGGVPLGMGSPWQPSGIKIIGMPHP